MESQLPLIWAGIIVFSVAMYVILDGYDLGIGILFLFGRDEAERDRMMNSIAPFWDGNETWLVLGGAGLLGAFPVTYSVLLPAVYLPIIVMLMGLIFRGVAFEFRFKAKPRHRKWDLAFCAGSIVATFCQGVVLGAFIQGVEVEGRRFAGGAWDWLTPFSVLTGFALISGYALLGATWIGLRTEGALAGRFRDLIPLALAVVLGFIGTISLWTPLQNPEIAGRWFAWPNVAYLSPVPIMTALTAWGIVSASRTGRPLMPFLLSIILFLLCFLGLGISLFPYAPPPHVTLWEAAASSSSLEFMLFGAAILIPLILGYTALNYRVFWGKEHDGYGH
tara:strand:- start:790 stop:1791 length:1002 start_codon:yes stop_codon:yes gene_type:complete